MRVQNLCLALVALLALPVHGQEAEAPAAESPAPPAATTDADEETPAIAPPGGGAAAERLGLALESDAPMTIGSDELEARRGQDGRERVVFQHNVTVEQGDMKLRCNWLEAIYPKRAAGAQGGGGRPERITARGDVRIEQAGNTARCSEAVFQNSACQAECRSKDGKATLSRGSDVIEADVIEFDLCKGVLRGKGGVRIRRSSGATGS